MKPGDVVKGASGAEYILGGVIGMEPDPSMPCDAVSASVTPDGRCRCVVCPRCGHHTGNSHQGHYWAYCQVTRTIRQFHFCCPLDPGCELREAS